MYAYNNKHSLRNNTKGYGGKSHKTDSQNSDITAPSGRELYHLQFSLHAASSETFGYTLVYTLLLLHEQLGMRKSNGAHLRFYVAEHLHDINYSLGYKVSGKVVPVLFT
jgi:hypothetical protein